MPNDIISLTEFKNDASGWAQRLQKQSPVVLTQNGKGVLVVQSLDAYRRTLDGLAMAQIVSRSSRDIEGGRTFPHEQVMAEVYELIDAIEKNQKATTVTKVRAPRAQAKPPVSGKARSAAKKTRG
jgi:PHD/YefM family antitoxin component YafN of YafNO toxin-antitoxin module